MAAQYDAIAEQYQQSKHSPLRTWVEAPTFLGLAGDVAGLRVLDLACGEGFYSRALAERGARVVGVDISPAMVALAREAERAQPLGIDYHCADVADLPGLGHFDLVCAAYLLHYASDEQVLAAMARNIARCLPEGGRFVTLNENPAQPEEPDGDYARYGFGKSVARPLEEGALITYQMLSGRGVFSFEAHWYSAQTYQRVLCAAGFRDIEWRALKLDPRGVEAQGAAYFEPYLARPPVLALECRR
jgi:SAM-dependent methyltransferase